MPARPSGVGAQDNKPEKAQVAAEHELLKKFVGTWDCDSEMYIEPGKPVKSKGSMTGHMIGDFWAVVLVNGEVFGQPYHGQGTFGFDSHKKKYIGTWAVGPISPPYTIKDQSMNGASASAGSASR